MENQVHVLPSYVRSPMKIVIGTILLILAQVTSVEAVPVVVQCSGEKPFGNQIMHVKIDIVLPKKTDKFVWIADKDGTDLHLSDTTPVGVGSIEITEILGGTKESHRHDLVVTRMPSDNNSMVGFYLTNSYINSVRVELWKKTKAFIYFDTYNNEVLRGACH